jgi:SAM-dependent methyltransferase
LEALFTGYKRIFVTMNSRLDAWLLSKSKALSRKGLYEFLAKEYATIPHGAQVLSIGAGGEVNELLQTFAKRNSFRFVSFDIDEARGPDIVGDICTYDFDSTRFDVVVMSEVLEHLHSPQDGLKNIHNILCPGGKLILTTPFILPMHDRPYDYFRFTRYGLAHLLHAFSDIHIRERNSYFEAIDVLWARLLVTNLGEARRACLLLIPFVFYIKRPFTRLLGKLIPTDAMTTGYVVTAIK